jgi:CDP-diacylglycerol--glycerol-3-phosphate 3-phosphatidyltransferase
VNLANTLTLGRILVAPLVAWFPFSPSWSVRLAGFVLFLVAAITDYWDGKIARSQNIVTDLGKLLDPLADKMLLVATLVPIYLLQRAAPAGGVVPDFDFITPMGVHGLPLWALLVVLGRELLMTLFRQIASRRGVIIAAIGPAKWKTGFQWTWVGAAFFWFSAITAAYRYGWVGHAPWEAFARFNGVVGVVSMWGAIALTLYSLWLYIRQYGGVLIGRAPAAGTSDR